MSKQFHRSTAQYLVLHRFFVCDACERRIQIAARIHVPRPTHRLIHSASSRQARQGQFFAAPVNGHALALLRRWPPKRGSPSCRRPPTVAFHAVPGSRPHPSSGQGRPGLQGDSAAAEHSSVIADTFTSCCDASVCGWVVIAPAGGVRVALLPVPLTVPSVRPRIWPPPS